MAIEVTFGSQSGARQIRNDPEYRGFLAESDDGRETTVKLKEGTPQAAVDEITGKAADSKKHRAEKAGQADLTRKEREQIDFKREGVNVPKVRSIKAIAANEGVSDYLSFADLTLTVDENRELLKSASQEERGRRGLGRDKDSAEMIDKRLAEAHANQQVEQMGRAKDFALINMDADAQSFVQQKGDFDIGFRRRGSKIMGQGEDFERLEKRHRQRSERAKTMDEKQSATKTRNPVKWANNPNEYDYPGIDTVQPHKLHEQRSERAQEADESELAPPADSKEQWANNPDQFDWRGVDTPAAMGLGPNQSIPTEGELGGSADGGGFDNQRLQREIGGKTEYSESVVDETPSGFGGLASAFDISLSPGEAFRGVGLGSPSAPGGQGYDAGLGRPVEQDRRDQEQAPPEQALQAQSRGEVGRIPEPSQEESDEKAFGQKLLDVRDEYGNYSANAMVWEKRVEEFEEEKMSVEFEEVTSIAGETIVELGEFFEDDEGGVDAVVSGLTARGVPVTKTEGTDRVRIGLSDESRPVPYQEREKSISGRFAAEW